MIDEHIINLRFEDVGGLRLSRKMTITLENAKVYTVGELFSEPRRTPREETYEIMGVPEPYCDPDELCEVKKEILNQLKEMGYYDDTDRSELEKNHPGRAKCDKLRELRMKIAEINDIPYDPIECHHTGPCLGTCPMCEKELEYLTNAIKDKQQSGEEVYLSGIEVLDKSVLVPEPDDNEQDDSYVDDIPFFNQ